MGLSQCFSCCSAICLLWGYDIPVGLLVLAAPSLPRPGSDTIEMMRKMEAPFWARRFRFVLLRNQRLERRGFLRSGSNLDKTMLGLTLWIFA